jgi:SWI/SNF-related matrix-associated actin-dependent regulator of chromatin subfamily A3
MQDIKDRKQQLLGEIETHIAGRQYREASVEPGEHVNLEREPENEHDGNAIRVENGHCEHLGYLPRERAEWLAPLMDADEVRIEGYVPEQAEPGPDRCPLTSTPIGDRSP